MGTLTSLLHLTTGTLAADQQALEATANNISNQNVAGYSRRSVTFTSGDSVTINGRSGSMGVTAAIKPQTDAVLQKAVWQATETSSASGARSAALNALQSLFALDSQGNDGAELNASLTGFFNAESALAAAPSDPSAMQTVLVSANSFAAAMNRAASQIAAQRTSLDQRVVTTVAGVNTLAASLASLNRQIVAAGPGADVSSMQDQRNQVVSQLASTVDVSVTSASDGSINLSLADGTPLVTGFQAAPLSTQLEGGVSQVYSGVKTVTSVIQGGVLGGTLHARDYDLPAVTSQLDAIASAFTGAVNTTQPAGTMPTGSAPAALFTGVTASTLTVHDVASQIGTGGNGDTAAAIAALSSMPLVGTLTLNGAVSAMVSGLGATASAVATDSTGDAAVLTQTSNQLDKLTGVSLDTEASNLTQYQRSYQAAAKVLAIVNELMAQAINLGSGTTVS